LGAENFEEAFYHVCLPNIIMVIILSK